MLTCKEQVDPIVVNIVNTAVMNQQLDSGWTRNTPDLIKQKNGKIYRKLSVTKVNKILDIRCLYGYFSQQSWPYFNVVLLTYLITWRGPESQGQLTATCLMLINQKAQTQPTSGFGLTGLPKQTCKLIWGSWPYLLLHCYQEKMKAWLTPPHSPNKTHVIQFRNPDVLTSVTYNRSYNLLHCYMWGNITSI